MVAYFLWSFADSTDEVVKQHGRHMVPGRKHAVVGHLHIVREGKKKSFMLMQRRDGRCFAAAAIVKDVEIKKSL